MLVNGCVVDYHGGVPTTYLDPVFAAARDELSLPDVDAANLERVRARPRQLPWPLSDEVDRRDLMVPGQPPVRVRVHRPRSVVGPAPGLLSMHGGGYVLGSHERDDAKLDLWCRTFGIVGVSVDYRLAPETPFPGPLDDCYAALRWMFDHGAEIGVDTDRIGITGSSAGGGLCAGLALLARDRGELAVRFQLLDAPMLDDRMQTPSSQADDLMVWSRASNRFGWESYLGERFGTGDVPRYAAAARAEDLRGLPDAYVCVGGADGFRDEDMIYAMRLAQDGVPTELHVYPGVPHGVSFFPQTEPARRYRRDQDDWLRRQLLRLA